MSQLTANSLARAFHETYERLAPSFGYKTRKESAVPWAQLPARNKQLLIAVCAELLETLRAEQFSVPKHGKIAEKRH